MTYAKKDPIEHVLLRPDMYVGSLHATQSEQYVWRGSDSCFQRRSITLVPGLVRVFLEILNNAIDNKNRKGARPMTFLDVSVCSNGQCSFTNDGEVIPIEREKDGPPPRRYLHSMIFGEMLTCEQEEEQDDRITSARNGVGAKLANIFSSEFTVDAVDKGRRLTQTWRNNMRLEQEPRLSTTDERDQTKVTFALDLARFGLEELSDDTINHMRKLLVDASFTMAMPVRINGFLVDAGSIGKYARFYARDRATVIVDDDCCVQLTDRMETVSFVNGIRTTSGGRHVVATTESIYGPIVRYLRRKGVGFVPSSRTLREHLRIIFKISVPKPVFESQEKLFMVGPVVKRKSPLRVALVKEILALPLNDDDDDDERSFGSLFEEAAPTPKEPAAAAAAAADILCYDKADLSGSDRAEECTLFVCDGLSSRAFVVAGIENRHDIYGIYPLRGAPMNVRNATEKAVTSSRVIGELMTVLGLTTTTTTTTAMNYGSVCIVVEPDTDGILVEGLLLNFLHMYFPSLFVRGAVQTIRAPSIKIEGSYRYALPPGKKADKVRCYAGLGSYSEEEAREIFHRSIFAYRVPTGGEEEVQQQLELYFDKGYGARRKEIMVVQPEPLSALSTVSDFLAHRLVLCFRENCARHLPSLVDGLKESQRKIVFAAKTATGSALPLVNVGKFASIVCQLTGYRHGEHCLTEEIVRMAQRFVGSNNAPLLDDGGQFGTRMCGGRDAAAPHFLGTRASELMALIFPAADDRLLDRRFADDGVALLEPLCYLPIVPFVLANGASGIGTGWSTSIPCFGMRDLCRIALAYIDTGGVVGVEGLTPSYRGFAGTVEERHTVAGGFLSRGVSEELSSSAATATRMRVTELPIGLWTDVFKRWLVESSSAAAIVDRSSSHSKVSLEFDYETERLGELRRKLTTRLPLSNMVGFVGERIVHATGLETIVREWAGRRAAMYTKRKKELVRRLELRIELLRQKVRIIDLVIARKIVPSRPETMVTAANKYGTARWNEAFSSVKLSELSERDVMKAELKWKLDDLRGVEALTTKEMWRRDVLRLMSRLDKEEEEEEEVEVVARRAGQGVIGKENIKLL